LAFARTRPPERYGQVCELFAHRGVHSRFKDLLVHHPHLDAWHSWEEEQTREALREGCEGGGLVLAD
jgi:hypothetical protein